MWDLQEQAEESQQELKEHLDRNNREELLKLVDLDIELWEKTSLAAFIDGFQLTSRIASDYPPYSFEGEEGQRTYESSRQWRGE